MNILTWLKNKAGKMPISITQAAGLTAVVGAAGFAAMSYLSSPSDTNTAFIPPTAYEQSGDVVYISQSGGGGQYESNGEIRSSFRATQSDSIRLANEQFERENQARVLEETDIQPSYAGQGESIQMPRAYQLGNGDVGLGMGGNADKQLNNSLDIFSTLKNQISNVGNTVNAQLQQGDASKGASQPSGTTPAAVGTSGQTAAQLANAPRNWGQSNLTRSSGGGSGVSNSFSVQNSGKNQRDREAAAALAEAGNMLASTREAMGQVQEGTRLRSRANFGHSDGLGIDRDATGQGSRRRYGNAKSELEWIRKRSADINANKTNSANEGGRPFLASAQISGGLVVNGENVTTGQGGTSNDLRSMADRQMRGIKGGLAAPLATLNEQKQARIELQQYFWTVFPAAMLGIVGIAVLMKAAEVAGPFTKWVLIAAAIALGLSIEALLGFGLLPKIAQYEKLAGSDGWSIFGYGMSAVLGAGTVAAFFVGPKLISDKVYASIKLIGPLLGFSGVGSSAIDMLTNKDQYLKDVEEADAGTSQTQEQNEQDSTGDK